MKKCFLVLSFLVGVLLFIPPLFAQTNPEVTEPPSDIQGIEVTETIVDDTTVIDEPIEGEDALINDEEILAEAESYIEGTEEGSLLWGIVDLVETKEGLYVDAEFGDVPPGKHGFHIHENGSCENKGEAAGGHFNPAGVKHGFFPDEKQEGAHVGDMGNVEIDEYGDGYLSVFLPGVSLSSGANSVSGKAIILHEKEDDFGQPTGNAGGRVGCGVVEIVEY